MCGKRLLIPRSKMNKEERSAYNRSTYQRIATPEYKERWARRRSIKAEDSHLIIVVEPIRASGRSE